MTDESSINNLIGIGSDNLNSVWESFRGKIIERYKNKMSSGMMGVFGSYEAEYKDGKTGRDVIDILSKEFCMRDFFVINGDKIWYAKRYKMFSKRCAFENSLHDDLKQKSTYTWGLAKVSRIFASIPPNAVFMLTKVSGTDSDEVDEFCQNRFKDKQFGVGFAILDNIPTKKCEHLEEIDAGKNIFLCSANDLPMCEKAVNEKTCIFYEHGKISVGNKIQKFVEQKFMCLCTVNNYTNIPNAAVDLLTKRRRDKEGKNPE